MANLAVLAEASASFNRTCLQYLHVYRY